ncbi:hypothetical protein NQ317_019243 [Molorchus minor]|uniref:Uncharacterized protein n=1 Tax=Molorchus minor TaxID=1323400 RepID=A0ABQ9JQ63_9CUCU|nr:hypothetical protein NQ317_019243 [Molorchus minor]
MQSRIINCFRKVNRRVAIRSS